MKYTTYLAIKYLLPPKNKIFSTISTWIAISGISIGVAALIVTLGIMTGFHKEIRERILFMYPHIIVTGDFIDKDILSRFKEIDSRSDFIYSQCILKHKNNVYSAVVKGVNIEDEKKVSKLDKILTDKTNISLSSNEIFLGKELAKNLDVYIGEEIIMILPTQVHTIFGNLPKTEKFVVKNIFYSGIYEYDNNLCYIDYNVAKNIFYDERTETFSAILGSGIRLKSEKFISPVIENLKKISGFRYKILSWEQLNYNLFSALKLEKIVMIIVVSLIIIVACFIIISNLLLFGIQKSKDIGILFSMGATRNEIKKMFFLQGIILNLSGISLGVILGLVLSIIIKKYQFVKLPPQVYYIDKIPVYISFTDLSIVLCIAIVVGILASIYPAQKVSQFNPIEIIRYG